MGSAGGRYEANPQRTLIRAQPADKTTIAVLAPSLEFF